MHRHAAIVAGLVCSKFNHLTNELERGSLTLEDFRNRNIKSSKELYTTVSDRLDQITSKKFDAPMFHNQFHLSAYVPKQTMNAADLIEATWLQSLWISNFKRLWQIQQYQKSLPIGLKIYCITAQKKQEQIHPTIQLWPTVTICIIRKLVQPTVTRKEFIHMKERTKFLMGTLFAVQVWFGMPTSITHLT